MLKGFSKEWLVELTKRGFSSPSKLRAYDKRVTGKLREFESFLISATLRPHSRILDVGCGPGREAIALARMGLPSSRRRFFGENVALSRSNARKLRINVLRFILRIVISFVLF
jgi:SAM-dependent methyltransferase